MTDARFPDRWLSDRRFARLSDAHFRAYVTSLVWSVTNRTDGVIEPDDLALIPKFAKDAVKAFLGSGLWAPRMADGRGWLIVDFESTQTTSAQLRHLDQKRANEREKKARQRAALKAATSTNDVVPGDIPGDVPTDDTGKTRTGKDRQGEGEVLPMAAGAENVTEWEVWNGEGSKPPRPSPSEWRGAGPDPYQEYK